MDAVRYPFAIGKDDYTKRLLFYVEHVMKSEPMYIDNIDYQMSYIRSDEAGEFIAYLVDKDIDGAINGSSIGTISLREIIDYVEENTGKHAILSDDGEIQMKTDNSSLFEYSIMEFQNEGWYLHDFSVDYRRVEHDEE